MELQIYDLRSIEGKGQVHRGVQSRSAPSYSDTVPPRLPALLSFLRLTCKKGLAPASDAQLPGTHGAHATTTHGCMQHTRPDRFYLSVLHKKMHLADDKCQYTGCGKHRSHNTLSDSSSSTPCRNLLPIHHLCPIIMMETSQVESMQYLV